MTIQDNITAAIKSNLQAISISGGYSFDMDSDRVFEFRRAPVDDAISISFYDDTGEIEDVEGSYQHTLAVMVVLSGVVATVQELRDKMQDVITAFQLIEDEQFVDYAELDSHEKDFVHDGKKISEAILEFTVYFKSDKWKI